MISFFKDIINLGINEDQLLFEQRKIRLVNIFALLSAGLMVAFSMLNIVLGANSQALLILSGCLFIAFPTIYLNKAGKYQLARFIFLGLGLVFVDIVTFRAVFNFQNRHNEVFLVGYSTLIVVLMDNPLKSILFSFNVVSTLVMITLRQTVAGLPITSDTIMGYLNALVAYGCVYFFISIFKQELIRSVGKVEEYGVELLKQEKEILKQRDQLFTNRQLLRSTIDSLPLFISMIDMKGKYLIANKKYGEVFGLPIDKIEGKHYSEILPESILKIHRSYINQGMHGSGQEFDDMVDLGNGESIHTLGKYIPVYNSNKEQMALAVYVVDVTQLKRTEAELVSLNETKNRLLSVISHDIRSPLYSLKGLINISENITKDNLAQFMNKVNDRLTSVTFDLDNLLNWAKGQMDGISLNPEKISINEIVFKNMAIMKDLARQKNVEMVYEEHGPMYAKADQESLNLVLRNILSNAIKFTPKDDKIRIKSFVKNDNAAIEITDSGKGISQEIIDQLAKGASTLISESGTEGEKGTGLGLTLSMDLVEKNEGTLSLSRNDVKGTTALIELPLA